MAKFPIPISFLLYLLHLLGDIQQYGVLANVCDPDVFYKPYVHLKKKRNGGDIASLFSSGFMDLRYRSRMILCINGPVVIYSATESGSSDGRPKREDLMNDIPHGKAKAAGKSADGRPLGGDSHHPADTEGGDKEGLVFTKGELMVFNHQCIAINHVPSSVLKKMKEAQGLRNPQILPDTQVHGKLAMGIYLVGKRDGHNLPELAWFKGSNYDYVRSRDPVVTETSFIMTSTNTSHCLKLPDGTHVRIGIKDQNAMESAHQVCRWTVKEEWRTFYDKAFKNGGWEEDRYEFYECPAGEADNEIILTMSKTTPDPISHANYTEFDPFAIFNPNIWTPHGYRRDSGGLSGGDERQEDRSHSESRKAPAEAAGCSADPTDPTCGDGVEIEMTTLRDMQNVEPTLGGSYFIEVGECLPLPVFGEGNCSGLGDNGQRLLELVLELEPHAKKKEETPAAGAEGDDKPKAEFARYQNLNDNKTLSWKYELLQLTAEIFSKLCMPFRAEMPFTISRVFSWYVYKAHLFGEDMGRAGPEKKPAEAAKGAAPAPAPTDPNAPAPNPTDPNKPAEPPLPDLSDQFNEYTTKTDTWQILFNELERCRCAAEKENGGMGMSFQWEVGDDTGKWKIPGLNAGMDRRRRRKRSAQPAFDSSHVATFFEEEDELVEEVDAETGKVVSRKKRAAYYKINGSVISTKYIQKGKSLAIVKSEGWAGFAREAIQEYRTKPNSADPRHNSHKYNDHPVNIMYCWNPKENPSKNEVICSRTEDLFFYEEKAEIEYELNIAIDIWWKIWATVIGYCNKAYYNRKSETFPRLYSNKYDYFFQLVEQEWMFPEDNVDLKVILSEYLTEESQVWLDACLEASYVNSNSQSYRPPRPMAIKGKNGVPGVPNNFEELPPYLYYRYHPQPTGTM